MWKVSLLALLLCSQSHQDSVSQTPKQPHSYETASEAIFGIGARLQTLQEEPQQNFLVSPLSAALVIGQLMIGAEGKFRQELYNLFSLPDDEAHQQNAVIGYYHKSNKTNVNFDLPYAGLHLKLANVLRELRRSSFSKSFKLIATNALFVNSNLNLKNGFIHNLLLYKTYIQQLDFAGSPLDCKNVINNWAAKQTNNLIMNILTDPPLASDDAIFTNAVYFKAEWENPFSSVLTSIDDFYINSNTNVTVEYMRNLLEEITYGESTKLGCKMIGLPYKDQELVMYIFLPNENNGTEYDINHFASNLKPQDVMEFINNSRKHDVKVQLPKMKLSQSISILKPLQKFKGFKSEEENTKASDLYLNNATENGSLKVSNILQQITLSVNEKGTEAAAVSFSAADLSGGVKHFKITRPFHFFIRHEATSAVLFWGSIVNPLQEI